MERTLLKHVVGVTKRQHKEKEIEISSSIKKNERRRRCWCWLEKGEEELVV